MRAPSEVALEGEMVPVKRISPTYPTALKFRLLIALSCHAGFDSALSTSRAETGLTHAGVQRPERAVEQLWYHWSPLAALISGLPVASKRT